MPRFNFLCGHLRKPNLPHKPPCASRRRSSILFCHSRGGENGYRMARLYRYMKARSHSSNSIGATPVFSDAAEARARQVATRVRAMQPDAGPAYVTAFLTFAGLQNTNIFKQWHEASYTKYQGENEYPSGDDPYIWGKNQIPVSAAWANVEIGHAVERLELSGIYINSFSRDVGARTGNSVIEDYFFAHYRTVSARLDGNENDPAEGSRLAQLMFARKDITGMLNIVSRGYANQPTMRLCIHASPTKIFRSANT